MDVRRSSVTFNRWLRLAVGTVVEVRERAWSYDSAFVSRWLREACALLILHTFTAEQLATYLPLEQLI